MSIFRRWKSKKPNDNPVAGLVLAVYSDRMECNITGDEVKVGGALVTLMLRHQHAHTIINNAVVAANREIARRNADEAFAGLLTTFNPN